MSVIVPNIVPRVNCAGRGIATKRTAIPAANTTTDFPLIGTPTMSDRTRQRICRVEIFRPGWRLVEDERGRDFFAYELLNLKACTRSCQSPKSHSFEFVAEHEQLQGQGFYNIAVILSKPDFVKSLMAQGVLDFPAEFNIQKCRKSSIKVTKLTARFNAGLTFV
jgi:hypothetical protein